MQQLVHYSNGVIKVEDTAAGFSATVTAGAVEALVAALTYARTLPPSGEQPVPPAKGRQRKASAPKAAPTATAPREAPLNTGPLTEVLRGLLKVRAYTVAELLANTKVAAVVTSDDPKRRRAAVAATLTRMVKGGDIVNIGDTYKVKG